MITRYRWAAVLVALGCAGCGGKGGGDVAAASAGPAAPTVTSVTLLGTTDEPATVSGVVVPANGSPVDVADADPRATAWSLTATPVQGEVEITITAEDAAGNRRALQTMVSAP